MSQTSIKNLVIFANTNIIYNRLESDICAGDIDAHTIFLDSKLKPCNANNFEYRIVLSIEEFIKPNKKYLIRRLSVYVRNGIYDLDYIIRVICKKFGFSGNSEKYLCCMDDRYIHNYVINEIIN